MTVEPNPAPDLCPFIERALSGSDAVATIVVNISPSGAAAYPLDPGGKPTAMIVGPVAFVIGTAVAMADPSYFLGRVRRRGIMPIPAPCPVDFGLGDYAYWFQLVAVLNGKSCVGRTRAVAAFMALEDVGAPINDWVRVPDNLWMCDREGCRKHFRTDRAKDIDAERLRIQFGVVNDRRDMA